MQKNWISYISELNKHHDFLKFVLLDINYYAAKRKKCLKIELDLE